VLVIGFIGFLLDRGMLALQRKVSWDKNAVLR
jgi:nitrate/nitrite transport system permease protein